MADKRIKLAYPTGSGNRRGWWKHVTSVDLTKKDGYSLIGPFLKEGENDLPLGAILICQYPTGSANRGWPKANAYRVTEGEDVCFAKCEHWFKEFLSFRDAIAAELEVSTPTAGELATHGRRIRGVALRAERARLVERLAEIDRQLADEHPQGAEDDRTVDHSQ
jgi:hypothetical protein